MTDFLPDSLRSWILVRKGAVQFKESTLPVSVGALSCLGRRVNTQISLEIAPSALGAKIMTPVSLTYKIKTGQWVTSKGTGFDVDEPKIKPLAEDAVETARDRLNAALHSPLGVHMGLASIYPDYARPKFEARPDRSVPLRAWRRADAAWMKHRISAPDMPEENRDSFDRAFDLIEQLDRPVEMQWVYFGRHDGAHRIALRVRKQLCNPIIALKTVGTTLLLDPSDSLNGPDVRRQVLGTHMIALVLALRRYGGLTFGDMDIGAYEVENFDQTQDGRHVLNLWIAASGWGTAVGQASRMKLEDLLTAPPPGIRFDRVADGQTLAAKTPQDKAETEREAQILERIQDQVERPPRTSRPAAPARDETVEQLAPVVEPGGWVSKDGSAQVAGRDIGGMVYVGTPPPANGYGYRDHSRPFIDPALRVASEGGDMDGSDMPYWPGYSDIPPVCRATYLDWLADGRKDASYNAGYMFLYFYGLERRFFLDDSNTTEKRDILREVERLALLYADNHSARRYLGDFMQVAQAAITPPDALVPVFDGIGWDVPYTVRVAIGAQLARGEALSVDWVLSWFLNHPERNLRTPAIRCAEEFDALFRLRFAARFPDGMPVRRPRKALVARYEAASGEFSVELTPTHDSAPVPDISGLRKPIETAQEIADAVMGELDKYSRLLGRAPEVRGTLAAQALLPAALWPLFPSQELEALETWARSIVNHGGAVRVEDVVERLEGVKPEKVTKRQLSGAADALARMGIGFAPDPRFALRAPVLGEPAVLFDLGGVVEQLEDVSPTYRETLVELALATFVAQADGQVTQEEQAYLSERVLKSDLSDQERQRMNANLAWLLSVPPDMAMLRRKLKDADPDQQMSIREALAAAAHADGVIQTQEIEGIEAIYKALGLDSALVYSDLHAGPGQSGPVRVRGAQSGPPGEAIPQDAAPVSPPAQALDAARIAAIRSDTARVSRVLGDIFSDDAPEAEPSHDSAALPGLDANLAKLVDQLIAQPHWAEAEFTALCQELDLMSGGALEAVNEWAFDTYGDALLGDYNGIEVIEDIAAAVRTDLGKDG